MTALPVRQQLDPFGAVPAAPARGARPAASVTWHRATNTQAQRVLVVDDSPLARRALARVLHMQGLDVIEADDGDSALAAMRTLDPDLVLLDAEMPGCDGFEVCRRIRGNAGTALTPIVMVTGHATTEDRLRGREAGADDFFAKPFEIPELSARVRTALQQKHLTDELEKAESVLYTLARAIEARDPETEGHCNRLSILAERLGRGIGLPLDQTVALRRAGIVHDIGKVVVPDAVLLKRGPLTADEWKIMQAHAAAGERICAPLKSFRLVLPIIRHHHERLDGTGYPDHLSGEAVPITARVLQIVDVYDALTMQRPYKEAQTPLQALDTIESEVRRGWWDGRVFEAFEAMVKRGEARTEES